MVAITKFLVFAAVAAASILPRDAAKVLSDLKTINTNTNTLTAAANNYNGGAANAIPIQNAYSTVDDSIKSATTDTNNAGTFTATQAQSIIDYINKTLEPSVLKAVNAIIAKKAKFQADGLAGVVASDLQTLKKDSDALATALVNKAPSAKKSAAQAAKTKIDNDLQKGINAFPPS